MEIIEFNEDSFASHLCSLEPLSLTLVAYLMETGGMALRDAVEGKLWKGRNYWYKDAGA